MKSKARGVWVAVLVCMGVSLAASGQVVPRVRTVSEKAFQHPDLFVPEVTENLSMLPATLVQRLRPTLASFGVSQESIFFDSRTGRPTSVILRQPMLPGSGKDNHLTWTAGKPLSDAALGDASWRALRAYLVAHKADLRLDPASFRIRRASASSRTAGSSSSTSRAWSAESRCATTRSAPRSTTAT